MSKLNELKKQYPELNFSVIDMLSKFDNTKSHKYLPLLCKLFKYRFNVSQFFKDNEKYGMEEIKFIRMRLSEFFDVDNMTDNEIFTIDFFFSFYNHDDFRIIKNFKDYNERNLIPNNDVTSYKTLDEVSQAVSLADVRSMTKEMENQVVKEFEDDTWLLVRPLTFSSSLRYGSSTKWCTTYKQEKQYFERYWKRGILVYCINKITGYKFAIFKSLDSEKELSFWNAADRRVDFLELEIEDYMYPIIKNLLTSNSSNRDFCDIKTELSVIMECTNQKKHSVFEDSYEPIPQDTGERVYTERPVMERGEINIQDMIDESSGEIEFRG